MSSRYHEVYASWQKSPEAFWAEAAKDISWFKLWDKVLDPYAGQYGRWFVGAECNTAYNCLDRHVERGRAGQKALIYDSPVTKSTKSYTYAELTHEVATLAGVLIDMGVKKGDRVLVYMPMIPEAVMAMLACARIGAIHSVVFGGFAAAELATRINDAKPVAIMAASCGIEGARTVEYKPLLDKAIELSEHKPASVLIYQRPMCQASMVAGRDVDWAAAVADAKSRGRKAGCAAVAATDPLYILYTSGTTGQPKGVVRDNGGHMVALKWSMRNLYGIEPGEVFWAASDVGWVVGHSYIAYAPLLHGATTLVFEGKPVGTPDAGTFWRVIAEHKVAALFTAPTAFRAIKKEDPKGELIKKYDLRGFRTLFLAGERADPETIKWAEEKLQVPVIDHWWQTETGWAIAGNPVGLGALPVKYGSPTVPMPGYEIDVLDEKGNKLPAGAHGTLAVKLPLPPSCLPTLWNNDARFRKSYLTDFPGYYSTSDAGYKDADGYVYVMARTDDVINVAGHRLSTGQMEEVVARHKDVGECAVIGAADAMKGQIPVGFIVLNAGVNRDPKEIEAEVVKLVRDEIGPVAAFKNVMTVKRLPKTRSGKILRGTMRAIADGESYNMPATIDDPVILAEITDVLSVHGMGKKGGAATTAAHDASAAPPIGPHDTTGNLEAAGTGIESATGAIDPNYVLRGDPPRGEAFEIAAKPLRPETAPRPVQPSDRLEFTVLTVGEPQDKGAAYSVREGVTDVVVNVGAVHVYRGRWRGLAVYDRNFMYQREQEEKVFGLWAHFIWPTIVAESNGCHLTTNCWDRAAFTWGPYQLAAHTANDNLILLFRELVKLPLAKAYFPDLMLHEGRLARLTDEGPKTLERVVSVPVASWTENQLPDFMAYLNPSTTKVENAEAITSAKLLHWAAHDPAMRTETMRISIEIMKRKLRAWNKAYGLAGRAPELALWISDIHHNGRATKSEVRSALSQSSLDDQLEALAGLDGGGSFANRCSTVQRHIDTLRKEGRFDGIRFGEGPLTLDEPAPAVA